MCLLSCLLNEIKQNILSKKEIKQKNSLIKNRMKEFLSENGISLYRCYKETGITRGVLESDSGITEDNLMKFISFYEVDLQWLIKGEKVDTSKNKPISNDKKEETKNIPKEYVKDEIIRLLAEDGEIIEAFKYVIGKEINTFLSNKFLSLIEDEKFFDTISKYLSEKVKK